MDAARVHLQKCWSNPLEWHSLSQSPSLEKQPANRVVSIAREKKESNRLEEQIKNI